MKLLSPLKINEKLALKNRMVMVPMGSHYGSEDCYATDEGIAYYRRIAQGGAGLIIVEVTCVHSSWKIFEKFLLGIWDDSFIPGLQRLAEAIQAAGCKAAIQLGCSLKDAGQKPSNLDKKDMEEMVNAFAQASMRALKAGFDALEFHMAHTYALADFLSRGGNDRRDAYGGELVNRLRLPREIILRTKEAIGDEYPIFCRINADEFTLSGNSLIHSSQIAQELEMLGASLIDVSAGGRIEEGGYASYSFMRCIPQIWMPDGVNVYLAEAIKRAVGVPVITAGKITIPQLAEEILQENRADLIGLGRPLLADPDYPLKTQEGRFDEIFRCNGCNACSKYFVRGEKLRCIRREQN
jgi:2,4-dienoyl-CoA reductase-like NADH-dependent reductase (Old Yellow Enzyme family)